MNAQLELDSAIRSDSKICDWRAALLQHAQSVWKTGKCGSEPDPSVERALEKALGPVASDARAIVEAYALGARRRAGLDAGDRLSGEDKTGLTIVFHGIEAMLESSHAGSDAQGSRDVIQIELWQLLRKVRESAELSYSREIDLIDLDRRILILLRNMGPAVPAEISGSVGVDKAQVSRSVKRLLELRMVNRDQIRAPLRLTRKGEALGKRLSRHAELRNRELTFDIGDADLGEFFATIRILLDRAVTLYEHEREAVQGSGRICLPDDLPVRPSDKVITDRTRIISPLLTLSAYFSRSGALAFKRLTGLSKFEAFVMQEIGRQPPIEWSELVAALRRDHSQAGRTVKTLTERGLIRREGKPGRRHGRFYPTAEGARQYEVIRSTSKERSSFLLDPLTLEQRKSFFATFDKIRRNASAQLERERALAELDRR